MSVLRSIVWTMLLLTLAANAATAQDYPNKPIKSDIAKFGKLIKDAGIKIE